MKIYIAGKIIIQIMANIAIVALLILGGEKMKLTKKEFKEEDK